MDTFDCCRFCYKINKVQRIPVNKTNVMCYLFAENKNLVIPLERNNPNFDNPTLILMYHGSQDSRIHKHSDR